MDRRPQQPRCGLSPMRRAITNWNLRSPVTGSKLIFLVRAAHQDPEHIIRQRPLRRLRFTPWCAHSNVPLLTCGQDHRRWILGTREVDPGFWTSGLGGADAVPF